MRGSAAEKNIAVLRPIIEMVKAQKSSFHPSMQTPPAFQLLKQYDETCGTNAAERVGNQYLKLARMLACSGAPNDEPSRNALSQLEAALFPNRMAAKNLVQTPSVDELFKGLNDLVGHSHG